MEKQEVLHTLIVFVAFIIQHAKCMHHSVIFGLPDTTLFFQQF